MSKKELLKISVTSLWEYVCGMGYCAWEGLKFFGHGATYIIDIVALPVRAIAYYRYMNDKEA